MKRIILTLLQDAALILAAVVFVTLVAAGIGYATGEVGRTWVKGEFRLADGSVVTAESAKDVQAMLENPDSGVREAVLTSGAPKGLPYVVRVAVLSFFAALGGVAVWRGRGRLPVSARRWRSIGLGAACGFGMSAFGWLYGIAVSFLGGPQVDWRTVFSWLGPTWLVGVVVVVVAPIAEELYFRGRLFALVEEVLGQPAAWVGTTAVFAVLHGAIVYLPAYSVLGAVLGLLRSRRNDLAAPVTAHMVTNAIALGLVYGTT